MTDFPDYSHMRADGDGRAPKPIVIPLNGQKYHAITDPPAGLILAATTESGDIYELQAKLVASGDDEGTTLTTDERVAMARAAGGQARRMDEFFAEVLEPDSHDRWVKNLSPLPEGATPAERKAHQKARITVPQARSVYQRLVAIYSGGRPTGAPSSSNGHGATGTTSTDGVQSTA